MESNTPLPASEAGNVTTCPGQAAGRQVNAPAVTSDSAISSAVGRLERGIVVTSDSDLALLANLERAFSRARLLYALHRCIAAHPRNPTRDATGLSRALHQRAIDELVHADLVIPPEQGRPAEWLASLEAVRAWIDKRMMERAKLSAAPKIQWETDQHYRSFVQLIAQALCQTLSRSDTGANPSSAQALTPSPLISSDLPSQNSPTGVERTSPGSKTLRATAVEDTSVLDPHTSDFLPDSRVIHLFDQ